LLSDPSDAAASLPLLEATPAPSPSPEPPRSGRFSWVGSKSGGDALDTSGVQLHSEAFYSDPPTPPRPSPPAASALVSALIAAGGAADASGVRAAFRGIQSPPPSPDGDEDGAAPAEAEWGGWGGPSALSALGRIRAAAEARAKAGAAQRRAEAAAGMLAAVRPVM
jgi:hypothetical protein